MTNFEQLYRVHEKVQHPTSDLINILPPNIIEKILTLLPIRDAFRTSILSRKWRYICASIPKLIFDGNLFEGSANSEQLMKYKFMLVIYQVLLLHRAPILKFKLSIAKLEICAEIDQILLYLSMSNTLKKFKLYNSLGNYYKLPSSFFSLQRLTQLTLSYCELDPPLTFSGFSNLTRLFLIDTKITIKGLQYFLSKCPQIKYLYLMEENGDDFTGGSNIVEVFAYLPMIEHLSMSYYYFKCFARDGVPQKLPTPLVHLRGLYLHNLCFMELDELTSALCLIRSSPHLEKLKVQVCKISNTQLVPQTLTNFFELQDFSDMNLDRLRELIIMDFSYLTPELEFVKLILARSSKLKKVHIVLDKNVSVDEELKILRNLLRLSYTRASQIDVINVERSELQGHQVGDQLSC